VVIQLLPLSPYKDIPVHYEYELGEPQALYVRFPNCRHCEIFCSTLFDLKIITHGVYEEVKFVYQNFGF
jgi:hypothetical protein